MQPLKEPDEYGFPTKSDWGHAQAPAMLPPRKVGMARLSVFWYCLTLYDMDQLMA
ncbi:MAG: hypothetical protein H6816_14875 [Phycisphaerales bacterium]|nr:hypothetical protein [Phycisphaerales bacterium]